MSNRTYKSYWEWDSKSRQTEYTQPTRLLDYDGTLLAVTHNRYLLNHCFDKVLHLENADIQEFDGNFAEYNFALLAQKIELQEKAAKQQEEIERNEKIVERMRSTASKYANATAGRALHARVSYLERLEARKIKDPFVELRSPKIILPVQETVDYDLETETEEKPGFIDRLEDWWYDIWYTFFADDRTRAAIAEAEESYERENG